MDVKLPNGQIISGVPEGASYEDVADLAVQGGLARYEDFDNEEIYGNPLEGGEGLRGEFAARMGRGAYDFGQGTKQLITQDPEYNRRVAEEIAQYEKHAGEGFDLGRTVGQAFTGTAAAMTGGPLLGAGMKAAGVGLPAWAAVPAVGAAEGALLATTPEDSRFGNAISAGLGAAGGYVGFKLAAPWASRAVDKVKRFFGGDSSVEAAVQALRETAQELGIPWETVSEGMKADMAAKVAAATASGMTAKEVGEAIARRAALEEQGMTATAGRTTQDPRMYTDEENIRKQPGGEKLQEIREQNLKQLHQRYEEIVDSTYPRPVALTEAGEELAQGVRQTDEYLKSAENEAYDYARDQFGSGAYVPRENIRESLDEMLGTYTADEVSKPIVSRLQKYIDEEDVFTVDIAEREIQRLNKLIKSTNDPQRRANAQELRHAILRDLDEVGAEGADAAKSWKAARKTASGRRGLRGPKATAKKPEIIAKILDRAIATEDIPQAVRRGKIEELKALMEYLGTASSPVARAEGHQALGKIRRALVDDIRQKITTAGGTGMSASAFQNQLREITPEKLRILFPAQADKLIKLATAAEIELTGPALSFPNYSNSGIFLGEIAGRFIDRMANKIPLVGPGIVAARGAGKKQAERSANEAFADRAVKNTLSTRTKTPTQEGLARERRNALIGSGTAVPFGLGVTEGMRQQKRKKARTGR